MLVLRGTTDMPVKKWYVSIRWRSVGESATGREDVVPVITARETRFQKHRTLYRSKSSTML
jgi:hypothetical protein